jgi:hypothetical protein
MPNKWTCEGCGLEFEMETNSETERVSELHENFGTQWKPEDCVKVCDDCYMAFMDKLHALPPS